MPRFLMVVLATCLFGCGCVSTKLRLSNSPRSSLCQGLLADSVRNAVADFDLARFRGQRVRVATIPSTGGESTINPDYIRQLLVLNLTRLGAVVVEEGEADFSIACLQHVGGLRLETSTFPPSWFFFVLPIYLCKTLTGEVSLELVSYRPGEAKAFASQSARPRATAYKHYYIFLIGPIHSSR